MSERPEIESLEDALTYIAELETLAGVNDGDVWPLVIELDVPIKLGKKGEPISAITVREPRFGDLEDVDTIIMNDVLRIGMDDVFLIASRLTDLPIPLLKKLPSKAAIRLAKVSRGFLVSCL